MDDQVGVIRLNAGMHLKAAGVRFDHPFGDGQAEADPGVAGGEERIGGAGGHFGGKAGAIVAGEAAILTEGEKSKWMQIIALGHLPLFPD